MSLKEFDAKQFLLEKGERVGLGVALTLMVLILIFSLFMPSKGFFSGSPAAKAQALAKDTTTLDNALKSSTNVPKGKDLPEDTKDRLIQIDTKPLQPENFATLGFFEPAKQESPSRRPPIIYPLDKEAVVAVKSVLLDTYLFSSDFSSVVVLRESGNKAAANTGGKNPFAVFNSKGNPGMGVPGAPPGAMSNSIMQRNRSKFYNPGANQLQGVGASETEYKPTRISVNDWNSQELTARQPRPLRVAIIAGSFPYKEQLEEFKKKLRLTDINAVLNETLGKEKESRPAFEFLGVEVQRMEVDAAGNKLGEWVELPLAQTYQDWLKYTFWPFQPEDPKIDLVKFDGLVLPLLRVFHPGKKVDPTMQMPGMMRPGMPQQPGARVAEAEGPDVTKDYPDVIAKLPKIQETLAKLSKANVQISGIAAPKSKTDFSAFDPFHPNAAPPADDTASRNDTKTYDSKDLTIPDYALVRLVDVNLEPGKNYKYRVRVKMANPNYQHEDVASPEYKKAKELTSKEWREIDQIARVPPELMYYVVDEKQLASKQELKEITKKGNPSAQSRLWSAQGPSADQVVFQFHRWVESTALSRKESDVVPVGDWAVADRVLVSRGEYVGRKVRVDLPIWKYTQNAYVLPAEKQEKRNAYDKRTFTGLDVDFGFDNSPTEDTILVDFEGGRVFSQSSKMDDTCRTEVLMLSPDGKLLARNSAKDTGDAERVKTRKKVFERIENIRQGKGAE